MLGDPGPKAFHDFGYRLQEFLLPRVEGIGIWQIDTGSINSILNINSDTAMVRSVVGHIAMVPLVLTLEPQQVTNPENGKKGTAYCLHLRIAGSLGELLASAKRPLGMIEMPKPIPDVDDEGLPDGDIDEETGEIVSPPAAFAAIVSASVPNPPAQEVKAPPAVKDDAKSPVPPATPERIRPSQYDRLRALAGGKGAPRCQRSRWSTW